LTPLVDIIPSNNLTLVATGSDHYFGEDPRISLKTIAMVKTIWIWCNGATPTTRINCLDIGYSSA
jgi:hypothetical protein